MWLTDKTDLIKQWNPHTTIFDVMIQFYLGTSLHRGSITIIQPSMNYFGTLSKIVADDAVLVVYYVGKDLNCDCLASKAGSHIHRLVEELDIFQGCLLNPFEIGVVGFSEHGT